MKIFKIFTPVRIEKSKESETGFIAGGMLGTWRSERKDGQRHGYKREFAWFVCQENIELFVRIEWSEEIPNAEL
jgi:hypothetical protein